MNFLSARWEHLLFASYAVAPEALLPHVPAGTSLDAFEGRVYVSLVAFLFRDTRVLGVPALLHRSFEEVNLRFYVSPDADRSKRAVTFIREIVPSRAIPLVANALFAENYVRMRMDHGRDEGRPAYAWGEGLRNRFCAAARPGPTRPAAGSLGEFITEHYWGYSRGRGRTIEYHVQHPPWECCDPAEYELDVDFGRSFGPAFASLTDRRPDSVLYAAGSAVRVSAPRRLARQSGSAEQVAGADL
ncbi:hypothetical protein Pla175_07090 [Pirellulimonas nuda]|uniref:DUF2071 domain-containing protein n=1 Tax=Pirellulimonas nuda TaxID=2528009 RepID=A0A518D788_9BACT|nr:DUF2071 domain-containing protein [Pirellulimonas nuda]QDU87350.1 hypothetical protein Pla175_07090 [Pirellulimonas nuda]